MCNDDYDTLEDSIANDMAIDRIEENIGNAINKLRKGLEEMAKNDPQCIYPNCANCGECYFREVLMILEGKPQSSNIELGTTGRESNGV